MMGGALNKRPDALRTFASFICCLVSISCGQRGITGDPDVLADPDIEDLRAEDSTWLDVDDPSPDVIEEDPTDEPPCIEIRSSFRMSDSPAEIAKVAWSGSEFGVVWWDLPEALRFARISSTGAEVHNEQLFSAHMDRPPEDLIWTGSEYAVLIHDRMFGPPVTNTLGLAAISPDGIPGIGIAISGPPRMDCEGGRVAWSGSEFGVAWYVDTGSQYDIYFIKFSPTAGDSSGLVVVSELSAESSRDLWGPDVVWTGSDWDVAWFGCSPCFDPDISEIMHARVSADGVDVSETYRFPVSPDAGISFGMNIATTWTGSRLGLAWNHRNWIHVTTLDETGTSITHDPVLLGRTNGSHDEPSIVWTGSLLGVSYSEESRISLATIDPTIMTEENSTQVSSTSHQGDGPDMVWTGSEFGIVWQEFWDGWHVYFGRVGFCP